MRRGASRNTAETVGFWTVLCLGIAAASVARAETVYYTFEDLILDDSNAQMYGTFSWTYEVGDFENGAGEFTYLDIPFTWHDHTDLDAAFDIGNSIEITLAGSVHDDGVDITLFLLQPLTPTTSSPIDLTRSRYEIGGNGFHTGMFLSGVVAFSGATDVGDPSPREAVVAAPGNTLKAYPNPFNPRTTVTYQVTRSGTVRVSILDVRGRLVTTLVDRWHSSGEYSVPWEGVGLASGLYFVRYDAGAESRIHKAVLRR